jgi:hypothetical protein
VERLDLVWSDRNPHLPPTEFKAPSTGEAFLLPAAIIKRCPASRRQLVGEKNLIKNKSFLGTYLENPQNTIYNLSQLKRNKKIIDS